MSEQNQQPQLRMTAWGVTGIGEIVPGDQLGDVIVDACRAVPNGPLLDGDVLVVTQKIVSKAEGRMVEIDPDDPLSHKALVEEEGVRVVRRRGDLIITETKHGFICANSGIDLSNVERGWAALLPIDSDRSARRIRDIIRAKLGVSVGIIISDTFGRPWRKGLTDVAIGVAGVAGVLDLRGTPDALGRVMQVTEVSIADEVASAAELVMGKSNGVPVAVVRGLDPSWLRESSINARGSIPLAQFFSGLIRSRPSVRVVHDDHPRCSRARDAESANRCKLCAGFTAVVAVRPWPITCHRSLMLVC
jgi:coenzyme F420-0:L-glutamate ligase / coenzyme F420-1:gamma-L-glutamate ligase